jgi:hypothetical protein
MKDWTAIMKLYKKQFNIDKKTLESMADYEVVLLCVSGMSNIDIAEFLELDKPVVDFIIRKHLDFDGWSKTMEWNPYYFYRLWRKESIINKVDFGFFLGANLDLDHVYLGMRILDNCVLFDKEYSELERNK